MALGWNRLRQFAQVSLLIAVSACGGGGSVSPGSSAPVVANVQIIDDAQEGVRPAHVVATFTAPVTHVATDIFVVGGTCTQAPAPVIALDPSSTVLTVSFSGGNCESGQTLTLTLDPSKATLANATLGNAEIWTRSFNILPTSQKIVGSIGSFSGTVVLALNGEETLTLTSQGLFEFPTAVNVGSAYGVTVQTQPVGQTCSVSSGSGVVGTDPVANAMVVCAINAHTVAGVASGLMGSAVVLVNNGGDQLTINAYGAFTFPSPVAYGSTYNVTVDSQPYGQTCTVSNGTGTMGGDVSNVAVVCANNSYSVGGTVTGIDGTLVLSNNGGDTLAITAGGAFTFPAPVAVGSTYHVTIEIQPVNQTCTVNYGIGTVGYDFVTNVTVNCSDW